MWTVAAATYACAPQAHIAGTLQAVRRLGACIDAITELNRCKLTRLNYRLSG